MKVDQRQTLFRPRNVVYGAVESTMWAWNVQSFRPPCRSRVQLAWTKGNFISVSFTVTYWWNSVLATLLAFQFPEHWKFKTFSFFILEYSMAPPSKPGIRNGEVCIWKPHADTVITDACVVNFSFLEFWILVFLKIPKCLSFFFISGKGTKPSSSVAQKGSKKDKKNKDRFVDDIDLVRRSDRKRTKVYETLNVNMLTDHRYLTGFEESKSPKKKAAKKRYLVEEESDSQTEGDEVKFEYCFVWFEIGANFLLFGANDIKLHERDFFCEFMSPGQFFVHVLLKVEFYFTNNDYFVNCQNLLGMLYM